MSLLLEKLNLMITTRCDSRCRYCIVRDTGEDMDPDLVDRGIDLLFRLGGPGRKLAFYGGEPLNRFDLIRGAATRVADMSARTGNAMGLFIYTNGKNLSQERIRFIRDHNIKTVFSLDGVRWMDRPREKEPANLDDLLATAGPLNVSGAIVILPDEAPRLPRVVAYYAEALGFRVVKILPGLLRYHWADEDLAALRTALDDTLRYVLGLARQGCFIFLDAVIESLHRRRMPVGPDDQHLSVMEIYPDGRMGLPPCEFTPASSTAYVNDIHQFDLGSAREHVTPETIIRAWSAVNRPRNHPRNRVLVLLGTWSDRVAAELSRLAPRSRLIRDYVDQALKVDVI